MRGNANWLGTPDLIQLGKTLNLQTVAEGVEKEDQLDVLRSFDCNIGQGYHFSKPCDAGGWNRS